MGKVDAKIANLWRYEFNKIGFGEDKLNLIGNNLALLDNPTFIPNAFALIGIIKKYQDDPERKVAHERVWAALPHFPSEQEVQQQRERTHKTRTASIGAMMNILNA